MAKKNDVIATLKHDLHCYGYHVYNSNVEWFDATDADYAHQCEDAPFIRVHVRKANEINVVYMIEDDGCCQHVIKDVTVTTVNKALRKIQQYTAD